MFIGEKLENTKTEPLQNPSSNTASQHFGTYASHA